MPFDGKSLGEQEKEIMFQVSEGLLFPLEDHSPIIRGSVSFAKPLIPCTICFEE